MRGTPYGRYELIRKIAAGGMAEIFLARLWGDGGFFRDVVIKRLFQHYVEHEPTLRMFQVEAQLLAELSHPNIPQAIELGFVENTWYLAMEYVRGWNIADVWRASVRAGLGMPLPVSLGVVVQVCEALHHAHECRDRADRPLRIIHRDVTPQNIMLTGDGVVKLMDFGVAKTAARSDTEAGAIKGTFSYMAPEQIRAQEDVDQRADVFAIGVVLYELTTGTRLFRGSQMQVMTAIVEEDAPPPSSRVPGYPEDLERIVLAALARDPRSRITTAADLVLHLQDFARRHGIAIGPRTLAAHVSEVFPSKRVIEEDLALVPAEPSEGLHAQTLPPILDWNAEDYPVVTPHSKVDSRLLDREKINSALDQAAFDGSMKFEELTEESPDTEELSSAVYDEALSELHQHVGLVEDDDDSTTGNVSDPPAPIDDPAIFDELSDLEKPLAQYEEHGKDFGEEATTSFSDEPTVEGTASEPPPQPKGSLASEPPPSLRPLPGFEDDMTSGEMPVVLLGSPTSSGDDAEEEEYMRELEKRLEDEPKD